MNPWEMMRRFGAVPAGGGGGDPYWPNVISCTNFPGTGGSTTITDATGKVWTPFGNAQIDTGYGPSLLLDGSGDYATTPDHVDWALGSGLFTEEGFFREGTAGVIRQIIGQHTTSTGGASDSSFLLLSDNRKLTFQVFIGSSYYTAANPSAHALATIHHYAACRDVGDVFRLYLNGVQVASVPQAGLLNNSSRKVTIGAVMREDGSPDPGGYYFNGRIMPRRMTKGVCRYPGGTTFTPPPFGPFPTG